MNIALLFLINFIKLFFLDLLLCNLIGRKARWYQLHCITNLIISIDILPSCINIIINPKEGYIVDVYDYNNNLVIVMHLYHILINKLNNVDKFHHILFVLLGVLPGDLLISSNQLYLHKIVCSGIPGVIKYGLLTLYKNDKISKINQKYLNTLLYVFFRMPLCLAFSTMNYYAYINGLINDNLLITIYVNFLLYLNGTVFTYLTMDSYFKIKYLENY